MAYATTACAFGGDDGGAHVAHGDNHVQFDLDAGSRRLQMLHGALLRARSDRHRVAFSVASCREDDVQPSVADHRRTSPASAPPRSVPA